MRKTLQSVAAHGARSGDAELLSFVLASPQSALLRSRYRQVGLDRHAHQRPLRSASGPRANTTTKARHRGGRELRFRRLRGHSARSLLQKRMPMSTARGRPLNDPAELSRLVVGGIGEAPRRGYVRTASRLKTYW